MPRGVRHSRRRDKSTISHHYDVGNDFYRLVLGPAMTYSCARFVDSASSLEEAQTAKHDLICRKLGLDDPGRAAQGERQRLLDVGCGWGSMAIHAASTYGADVVGVTISEEQASLARRRVDNAGLTERVEIRMQDYREVPDGPFDAISSIGMAEHVGKKNMVDYFRQLHSLVRPGGRVMNHAIASGGGSKLSGRHFMHRYVFPDGELLDLGDTIIDMERAGFEVRDVENLREHYATTLRHWVANLERDWDDAVALVGEGRCRVWQLYMSASINGFDDAGVQLYQTLGVRPHDGGRSDIRARRRIGRRTGRDRFHLHDASPPSSRSTRETDHSLRPHGIVRTFRDQSTGCTDIRSFEMKARTPAATCVRLADLTWKGLITMRESPATHKGRTRRPHSRSWVLVGAAALVVTSQVGAPASPPVQAQVEPPTVSYDSGRIGFGTEDLLGGDTNAALGDRVGTSQGRDGDVIDTSTSRTGDEAALLYPIDSSFTTDELDFFGATPRFRDGVYEEGFAGDIPPSADHPEGGLEVSDVATDLFKAGAPLGTWAAGLGSESIKASTEHYTVMEAILTCYQTYEYDFWTSPEDYAANPDASVPQRTRDQLEALGLSCEQLADPRALNDLDGAPIDLADLIPNEDSVIMDMAVDPDNSYSVTKKDDGKLLFRWGSSVKKPTDIRFQKSIPLPAEWKDAALEGQKGYRVTRAELIVNHNITNNPNDQIRPDDWENEGATGRLPDYEETADGFWLSKTSCYEGNGNYIPAGTILKYPAGSPPTWTRPTSPKDSPRPGSRRSNATPSSGRTATPPATSSAARCPTRHWASWSPVPAGG